MMIWRRNQNRQMKQIINTYVKLDFNLLRYFIKELYLKAFGKGSHKLCTKANTNRTGHPCNKRSKYSSISAKEKIVRYNKHNNIKKSRKLDNETFTEVGIMDKHNIQRKIK